LNALADLGLDEILLTLKGEEEQSAFLDTQRVDLVNIPRGPWGPFRSWTPAFRKTMVQLCRDRGIQLVHNHGVWLPSNHTAAQVAVELRLPLIHSPRGMLTRQQIAYRPLKKKLAWWSYQRKDMEAARVVHVTAPNEGEDLRTLGFRGALAVIPNGVNIPVWIEKKIPSKEPRTALFFSRIHPKKNLSALVEAWSLVRPRGWRMRIVGPDVDGHRAQIEELVLKRNLEDVFSFEGPVYGESRWDLYRAADLFILPTLSENFGIAVPEALACGIPVITTEGAPWSGLKENNCGWWIPIGAEPLAEALKEATESTDSKRKAMGRRGRAWVEKNFTWESAALKMKSLYEWVLGGGNTPSFIQMD
jgi:glycosyltransferase involved in cell wall biosynthesis